MTRTPSADLLILFLAVLSVASCEQTLRTGKVGNTRNAPSADGTCPAGLSLCGQGNFAQCLDLQADREHCGSCDQACVPGIACAAGVCQQIACTGDVTVSTQTLAGGVRAATSYLYAGGILADINGDGRPDLVTWEGSLEASQKSFFKVALGGPGGFATPSTYQPTYPMFQIVAGDSNLDGFADLYLLGLTVEPSCVEVWLGHADGSLSRDREVSAPGCIPPVAIGDLNGDGQADWVTSEPSGGMGVYLADANGDFHTGTRYPSQPAATVVRDWNGDGFPDLLSVREIFSVYLNDGYGRFDVRLDCGVATSSATLIVDFNRDGHLDLATPMGDSVGVLLGMGGCQFQPMIEYPLTDRIEQIANGDVNGDGADDLVARLSTGELLLLPGAGDGTFHVVPLAPAPYPRNHQEGALLVGDVTGDGKADVVMVPGQSNPVAIGSADPVVTVSRILENTCP